MTEPTPGPWTMCGADRGGCKCGQVWSDDRMVAIATYADNAGDHIAQEVCVESLDEMLANMRLIAAAPQMLKALRHAATALAYANQCAIQDIKNNCSLEELKNMDDSIYQEPLDMVRAALRKARGET